MRTKLAFKKILTCILALTLLGSVITVVPAAAAAVTVGDVDENGKIDAADALMVLKAAVKKITLTEDQTTAGDVDATGILDAADALMILQYAVKLRDTFPAQLDEQARYYYDRDHEYKVDYSDFDSEITTVDDGNDPAALIEALGGDPAEAPVEEYGVTADGKLSYTPISKEAKRLGQTKKYDSAPSVSGTLKLGDTVVTYSIPSTATAYDAVPIAYSVYSSTENLPIHLEATAFEEAQRYENTKTPYYDCNLPGTVAVNIEYEGYVNGTDAISGKPSLTPDTTGDAQGTRYPAFDTTQLQKTGTLKSGADYTWLKWRFTNTGNTILDGEGNSAFRFKPMIYKKTDTGWTYLGGTINDYYPLLDYVYPGESGEFWTLFALNDTADYGLDEGQYRVVIQGCMRNEQDAYNFGFMQLEGAAVTTATFEFEVTQQGGMTAPNPVKNTAVGQAGRNRWLGNFEEFMSSYTTLSKVGAAPQDAAKGVMYIQPAPWTDQIVLKVIHGNTDEIACVRIPLAIETDSLQIHLNPDNKNYVIKEDGTRTPMVMTQNMADMRGNIDRGPYCDDTILNELRNMKEAGVNTITTTHVFTGALTGVYDMDMYMLDCARKLGFDYEGHCTYYYRYRSAIDRVRYWDKTVDLGSARDLFNSSQIDAANGILARWNLIRYGDFYVYDKVTGEVPISIEENYGWMTYKLNNRDGIGNSYSDRLYYKWLEEAYDGDITALNRAYGTSYSAFREITLSDHVAYDGVGYQFKNTTVYGNWNAATVELDLFRTAKRTEQYAEMLKYLDVQGAKVYLRSENSLFLAPGISQTTTNARYRQVYYEQRQAASVPEVLAASGIIYGDSSYCWVPFDPSEVYELTRQTAKIGLNTAKTVSANHMTDIVMNQTVGNYTYADNLSTGELQKGCAIGRSMALFPWCKAIYEAGGVPGVMWMDYACDLYVTSTQYKELQFFNEKIEEMLATEAGRQWATNIPAEETVSPLAGIAVGAYSYPESYIEDAVETMPRRNIIMEFCANR